MLRYFIPLLMVSCAEGIDVEVTAMKMTLGCPDGLGSGSKRTFVIFAEEKNRICSAEGQVIIHTFDNDSVETIHRMNLNLNAGESKTQFVEMRVKKGECQRWSHSHNFKEKNCKGEIW